MAALLTIPLLLLCHSITASEGSCDYNVATDADFTVPLEHKLVEAEKFEWKHNNKKIFDGRLISGKILVTFGSEKDITSDGSLNLTKVGKTNAGTYSQEVFREGKQQLLKGKSLCVFDRVTKPVVKILCGSKTKESQQVTFTCSFNETGLQIEWLKNKEVIQNEKVPTLKQDGKKVEKDSFSCSVSNAVSSMVSEPVTQHCFKSKFSFFYDKVMGVQIWIIIASGGGVVVLLILTIIVCCIMNKRKRHMNLKDEEELRLGWTNTEQQQQHQQHHSHNHNHKHHHHNPPPNHQQQQQQSAGHTGPRQNRSRQQREQRPRLPEPPGSHPQPSPRRAAQGPGPAVNHDDEQPPPLPQPRKKAPM